jgi:ubiquinone/menaquinone biosynthesis C-methylase UbiE
MHLLRTFTRFFLNLLYRQLAWMYDLVAALVSGGQWKDWGRAALPYLRGTRVLELGFGPGHIQTQLTQSGQLTIGLDASPQMARQARKRLQKNGLPHNLIRGYAQIIPLQNESIESVLATFPTEYIFDPRTLREIWRVLRPNGVLVIVLMAEPRWSVLKILFRVTDQGRVLTEEVRKMIEAPLTEAGFGVVCRAVDVRGSTVHVWIGEKIQNFSVESAHGNSNRSRQN